jgi:aminoglycoside 6'-N-acetyltransferase I
MLEIRAVTSRESEIWRRMRCELWPDPAGHRAEVARFFAGDRREPAEVLIAFDTAGDAVGFAELSIRNVVDGCSTGNVGYLEGWYVAPAVRREGVGRALIAAAEQWARRQGCTEFGSDASIDNEVSVAAHRALGFEETSRGVLFRKDLCTRQPTSGLTTRR